METLKRQSGTNLSLKIFLQLQFKGKRHRHCHSDRECCFVVDLRKIRALILLLFFWKWKCLFGALLLRWFILHPFPKLVLQKNEKNLGFLCFAISLFFCGLCQHVNSRLIQFAERRNQKQVACSLRQERECFNEH